LSNTVNSIEGSLGTAIDAALADGLTSINEVIAALQAQVDNIATSEDVDNITETLGGVEQDLQDLLDSNNVYSNPVNIYNVATLDFADALGDRLNIVNSPINIYAIPEMDSIKLQTVVNRIKVVVGNFNYFAKNSEIATISFNSLSAVLDLIVAAPHNLSFSTLSSAGKITLGTNYDNKVKGFKFNPKTQRKEIGGFPKHAVISSHDLRRSFATNFFGKISTPILMNMTGHSKESTFMTYIGRNPNRDSYADTFMEGVMQIER
jgi:hypothetical protein